jgi:aspartyl-tRNA(Asn)/glutamyl-tRNA(Gln) amidotransferase subunit A
VATHSEICRMDALALAAEIRARRISPVEAIDAVFQRMERLEPHLHAFCTPAPELARADAKRIEENLAAGRDPGPLAGVPVSVKDLIFTRAIRTTSGSVAYRDFIPDADDVIVERLKRAGAIVIGKTNAAEFGYAAVGHNPVFETTRNPWNTALTTGGSSAGAGAAVAAGIGPIATAADRFASRRRSAASTVLRARWGASRSTPARATNALRAHRDGNRSNVSAR